MDAVGRSAGRFVAASGGATRAWLLSAGFTAALAWGAASIAITAEPRAARSVHLGYPASDAVAFSVALTVLETAPGSYFMAAGWNTGYCGLQELADGRRVVIFSVWDPPTGDDPVAVSADRRVECLFQAADVGVKRFGGEGTGGQCLGDLPWRVGVPVRFAVTAAVHDGVSDYAGFVQPAEATDWKHLVTFRSRIAATPLRGLYSFVEDFRRDGRSVGLTRRAAHADVCALPLNGTWQPLVRARFTASNADWEAKDSIDATLAGSSFILSTGGDTRPSRPLGSVLEIQPPPAVPAILGRLPLGPVEHR